MSPVPFSLASSSSKSLKFRGIIIGAAMFEKRKKIWSLLLSKELK